MEYHNPSLGDVEEFVKKAGVRKGEATLKLLGNLHPFTQAINSQIGRELLKDDILRHEELLMKMYEEMATDKELAELRYLKNRILKVSERVTAYIQKTKEVISS